MLIGEISKRSGLSRDTIRYYEKRGLISAVASKSPFNNYKNYDESVLQKLNLIKQSKSLGFTLKEIAELSALAEEELASCIIFKEKVENKLKTIDYKINELQTMKRDILIKMDAAKELCNNSLDSGNCGVLVEMQRI